MPVTSLTPTKMSMSPNAMESARLLAYACNSAPARPPAALITPKLTSTRRSTCARSRQNRRAVAKTCGIEIAATASCVPTRTASNGVSKLPIPKPTTDATAPATAAVIASRIWNVTRI